MIVRLLLAGLHLLALGIGLGSVWVRARALRGDLDTPGIRRVLSADSWWVVAGALWLATGLVRLFTGLEKGSGYYFGNHVFLTKMALFLLIVVLEVRAIRTLGSWRKVVGTGSGRGTDSLPDTSEAAALARISTVQAWIVVVMVFLAVTMARGIG